jgi:glycosyltransferase involved in cell wall biosynthesis
MNKASLALNNLPNIANKTGWPWSEQSLVPDNLAKELPKISIITPSFNQGRYLEETIRSIVLQNYPNYQLIIIDAGSTDETLDVIRKYEPWISYWVSEKDRGQSHAILKGLDQVTGDIVNWINSDDICAPGAFYAIASAFDLKKYDVLCGRCNFIEDTIDNVVLRDERMGVSNDVGNTLITRNINQPSAFFRAEVMKMLRVDEQFHYAMDLDMWFRYIITKGQTRVKLVDDLLTFFRLHGASKSVAEADKFQNDINKVYYNILLGAKQPRNILFFAQSIIQDFHKFVPVPYTINIPIKELNSFFSSFAFRAAQFYYEKGKYDEARTALKLGVESDIAEQFKNTHLPLIQRLQLPNSVISVLRRVKNWM